MQVQSTWLLQIIRVMALAATIDQNRVPGLSFAGASPAIIRTFCLLHLWASAIHSDHSLRFLSTGSCKHRLQGLGSRVPGPPGRLGVYWSLIVGI